MVFKIVTHNASACIIAGLGDAQAVFHEDVDILARSPMIRGWIEDPDSMPPSLQKDGALYLPNCEPSLVRSFITYLKTGIIVLPEGDPSGLDTLEVQTSNPLFCVKLYKLALRLAVEELCETALRRVQARKHSKATFIGIALETERQNLIEEKRFRDWMIEYIAQNAESLKESKIFKSTVQEGGQHAWALCSIMMAALGHLHAESKARQPFSGRSVSDLHPSPPLNKRV